MTIEKKINCPLCFSEDTKIYYEQKNIPVFNNLIYETYKEAVNCKKGNISLTLCNNCGFIFNSQFNNKLLNYNENYDSNQFCSDFFQTYVSDAVDLLVNKYKIKNARILEIGCGNGEFLKLLCQKSGSRGIGIDPAYKGEKRTLNVRFIKDYFREKYYNFGIDILVMRHVLEHIEEPFSFLNDIIKNLRFSKKLTIIIEVPDFKWISKKGSFWDVTYEHCNYFTKESLNSLFKLNYISQKTIFSTFANQYIITIGEFEKKNLIKRPIHVDNRKIITDFIISISKKKAEISSMIEKLKGPLIIWGAAGKGVIFTNMLDKKAQKKTAFLIDINKAKQGKYCPGVGHKIMPPSILKSEPFKNIMIMNSNYRNEILWSLSNYNRKFNFLRI